MKNSLYILSIAILLSSCDLFGFGSRAVPFDHSKVMGLKPVYALKSEAKQISYSPTAHPSVNPTNTYAYGNLIFQTDAFNGIHIIDNSIPSNAHKIGFIDMRGTSGIAIINNKIYASNFDDIVVINMNNYQVEQVLPNTFNGSNGYYWQKPSQENVFYECPRFNPDSIIVKWVQDSVYQYCRN